MPSPAQPLPTCPAATLVAHHSFDDAGNLGNDSSGFANHATTVTNVTAVPGQFGGGAFFNEGAGSVFRESGGLNGLSGLAGRSYAAWVKLDPGTAGYDGIFSQDAGGCCTTRFLFNPAHLPFINLNAHIDRTLSSVSTRAP